MKTALLTRRAAILTSSAALAAGWGRGNFTGTVRTIGPGQQYQSIAAAHTAANNGDLLLCAANATRETLTISKNVWLDFSACVWDYSDIPWPQLTGGGLAAIAVSGSNVRIYAGEVMGVALDMPSAGLAAPIRMTAASGDISIIGGYFHNNQNGLTSNPGDISITVTGTRLSDNGLAADKDHCHNAYIGGVRRLTLINVDSRNPLYAHSIKTRGAELHVQGGFFESPSGACFDMPEGGKFTIENCTMQKLVNSPDQKFLTYAVENTNQGLTNANWIQNCSFDLRCPVPYFFTQGGTINLLAGNNAIGGISPSVVGSGTVVGLPIPGGTGITPDSITATNLTLIATTNAPVSSAVGSFTCNNASITAGDLTGTVNWGEGGGVVAGVVSGSVGHFTVAGAATHTYTTSGSKPAVVTVLKETATPTVTATCTSTMTVSDPVVGSAQAVVTFGSTVYTFNETEATDIGSISDPLAPVLGISSRFTMSCKLRTLTGCPLRVYFRRIAAPNAFCYIVFELGDALTGQSLGFPPYGPYNVTMTDGSGNTHTYTALTQYHWTRWRWVFNTWPFTVTPTATLISLGLVPNYSVAIGAGRTQDPYQLPYPTPPMSVAGIPPYMSQGGEGDVIGINDGWTGAYLCGTNTAQHLNDMLANLEGSASEPWHYRDMATGAPIDTVTYPNASTNPGGASPWFGWTDGASYSVYPGIETDTSHMPDKAYVPFLLQGDPYALEEMQLVATFTVCSMPAGNRGTNSNWNINHALRGMAWATRNRARTTLCTPSSVPGWLKPKSYWQTMMDQEKAWLMANFVNGGAPYSGLHMGDGNAAGGYASGNGLTGSDLMVAPWQDSYFGSALAHIVQIGFSDWLPIATWHCYYLVGCSNGTSGWNRSSPVGYRLIIRQTPSSPYVNTFTDLYNLNYAQSLIDPETFNNVSPPGTSQAHLTAASSYDVARYAALAMYTALGITGADAVRAWMLPEIQTLSPYIAAQWCIA